MLVEGRLQVRSYDGKDGMKRWVTEVIADTFEFIERREGGSSACGTKANGDFTSMGTAVPFDEKIPF